MNDVIRVPGFLQRTLKRLNQIVRQLTDKSNRIGKQDLLSVIQRQSTRSRIQSCKKLVLGKNPCACQSIQ